MDLPLKFDFDLPFSPEIEFKIYKPYRLHPLYTNKTHPAGCYLHPRTNTWTPFCSACTNTPPEPHKLTLDPHKICECQDTITPEPTIPTTALADFFPLCYKLSDDRRRSFCAMEAFLASEKTASSDLSYFFSKQSETLNFPKETTSLMTDKIITLFKEFLRDRPLKASLPDTEALAFLYLAFCSTNRALDNITKQRGHDLPTAKSTHSALYIMKSFIQNSYCLARGLAQGPNQSAEDFQSVTKQFTAAARRLKDAMNQAEMMSQLYSQSLPVSWRNHTLLKHKSWFAHPPTKDTAIFLNDTLAKLHQAILLVTASGSPRDTFSTKTIPRAVTIVSITIRSIARLTLTCAEYESFWTAQQYWQDQPPTAGIASPLADPPTIAPLSTLLQARSTMKHSQPTQTSPPQRHGQSDDDTPRGPPQDQPLPTHAQGTPPTDNPFEPPFTQKPQPQPPLYPPLPPVRFTPSTEPAFLTPYTTHPSAPAQAQPHTTSPKTATKSRPPQTPPTPTTPVTPRPRTRAQTRGANIPLAFLTLILCSFMTPAQALKGHQEVTINITRTTNNTTPPPLDHVPLPPPTTEAATTPPIHAQSDSRTTTFVADNIMYTHLTQRAFNPNFFILRRPLNTKPLHNAAAKLPQLAHILSDLCDRVLKQYPSTDDRIYTFHPIHGISPLQHYTVCNPQNLRPALIYAPLDASTLAYTMLQQNISVTLAPISTHANVPIYPDGTKVPLTAFDNYFSNSSGDDIFKGPLPNHHYYRFLYVAQEPTSLFLVAYPCPRYSNNSSNPSPYCTTTYSIPCVHTNMQIITPEGLLPMPECGQFLDNIITEAANIQLTVAMATPSEEAPTTTPHGKPPLHHRIVKRAVTAFAAIALTITGLVSIVSLGSYINNGITKAQAQTDTALLHKAQYDIEANEIINAAQQLQIQEISSFVVNQTSRLQQKIHVLEIRTAFATTLNHFRILTNTITTGLNSLAMTVMATQIGRPNPAILTSGDLARAALSIYAQHGIKISTTLDDIQPLILRDGNHLITLFRAPIIDNQRQFSLFTVTPIPDFSDEGFRTTPLDVPSHVAIQTTEEGYIIPSITEVMACTSSPSSCHTTAPVLPAALAPCGIAPLLNQRANCTYTTTQTTSDFYNTAGNYTCYSVRNPVTIRAFCQQPTTTMPVSKTVFHLDGTGCFSHHPSCSLKAPDGTTILPSTTIGSPYNLPAILSTSTSQTIQTPTLLTPPTIEAPETPGISTLQRLPRSHRLWQPPPTAITPPLYSILLGPTGLFLATAVIITCAITCYVNRRTTRYKKILRTTDTDLRDHQRTYHNFTTRFASYPSPDLDLPPLPTQAQIMIEEA